MTTNNIDQPESMIVHGNLIRKKGFLKSVYTDFYHELRSGLSDDGVFVELGSGGGFIKEVIPKAFTTDLVPGPGIDAIFSAEALPFRDASIDAFLLLNVFHHLKDPNRALAEMARCLTATGMVIMVEPHNTWWARFFYRHFHFETFDPQADWRIRGDRRISDANDALAWIVFVRDRVLFEQEFPQLRIELIKGHTPFSYMLSGGVTREFQFAPTWLYPLVTRFERFLSSFPCFPAMFVTVRLRKS
jgi:SAM-dependent methyltransferase